MFNCFKRWLGENSMKNCYCYKSLNNWSGHILFFCQLFVLKITETFICFCNPVRLCDSNAFILILANRRVLKFGADVPHEIHCMLKQSGDTCGEIIFGFLGHLRMPCLAIHGCFFGLLVNEFEVRITRTSLSHGRRNDMQWPWKDGKADKVVRYCKNNNQELEILTCHTRLIKWFNFYIHSGQYTLKASDDCLLIWKGKFQDLFCANVCSGLNRIST